MDFLDPVKKRAHGIRLFIGYFLMAIALVLAAVILLFQAYGYDLDRSNGTIIQNGLVFVTAQPESARIYINDKLQKAQTDARLTLPAGQYTIRLERDNYLPWQRTFRLNGGSVERLQYPFLFPKQLSTKDVQLYAATPPFATQSPDRHWLLVQPTASLDSFDVFDLGNPNQIPTKLTIPAGLLTASKEVQSWKMVEWSTDNRHVLLAHNYGTQQEFIMVDRDTPTASFNVNKLFKVNPTQVALHDKHFDSLFLYDAVSKVLNLANVKDQLASPYLNGVVAFKSYGSNLMLYATVELAPAGKVLVRIREDANSYTIREISDQGQVLLDMAKFDDSFYTVFGNAGEGRAYVYKDPLAILKKRQPQTLGPISILRMDNPTQVSFSSNTRFIMTQSGNKFAVYDAEDDLRFSYQLKFNLPLTQPVNWMDGHRLLLTQDNKTFVFDFDGINQHFLSPTTLPQGSFFDRDYTRLFTIGPSSAVPGRAALTQTELKVKS